MKKTLLLSIISIFTYTLSTAQSYEKGSIQIDVGFGLGIYGTEVQTEIAGNISKESDGTASTLVPVKLQYGIADRFSIGVLFQAANYIEDEDSASVRKEDAKGSTFRIIGTVYILNTDKFNLHAELGLGAATFNQDSENQQGEKIEADWRGGNFALGLGMKYFFSNRIGFFAQVDYNAYAFELDELAVDNATFDIDNWEADFSGSEITVGLAIKL